MSSTNQAPLLFRENFLGENGKGFDKLQQKLQSSIDAISELLDSFQLRVDLEQKYATGLNSFAKKSLSKSSGSVKSALERILTSTATISKGHEVLSSTIKKDLDAPLQAYRDALRRLKKSIDAEHEKYYKAVDKDLAAVEKAKRDYIYRCKEWTKFYELAAKAAVDTMTKKKVDELHDKALKAKLETERAELDYKGSIAKYNSTQDQYEMKVFWIADQVQKSEEERITITRNALIVITELQAQNLGAMASKIWLHQRKAIDIIDAIADNNLFVDSEKTGNDPVPRLSFESFFGSTAIEEEGRKSSVSSKTGQEGRTSVHTQRNVSSTALKEMQERVATLQSEKEAIEREREEMKKELSHLQTNIANTVTSGINAAGTSLTNVSSQDNADSGKNSGRPSQALNKIQAQGVRRDSDGIDISPVKLSYTDFDNSPDPGSFLLSSSMVQGSLSRRNSVTPPEKEIRGKSCINDLGSITKLEDEQLSMANRARESSLTPSEFSLMERINRGGTLEFLNMFNFTEKYTPAPVEELKTLPLRGARSEGSFFLVSRDNLDFSHPSPDKPPANAPPPPPSKKFTRKTIKYESWVNLCDLESSPNRWTKRWCVLEGGYFGIFSSKEEGAKPTGEARSVGMIAVVRATLTCGKSAAVSLASEGASGWIPSDKQYLMTMIAAPGRKLLMAFDSEEDMMAWHDAIVKMQNKY